MIFTALIKVV